MRPGWTRRLCATGVPTAGVKVGNWNEIPFRIAVSRNLFQLFHVIGVIFVWRSCENAIITMSGFTTHFHAFLWLSVLNRCKWPTGFPPSYLNFKLLPLRWPKDGYYTYTTPPCCKEGRKTSWHPLNTVCYYANTSPWIIVMSFLTSLFCMPFGNLEMRVPHIITVCY